MNNLEKLIELCNDLGYRVKIDVSRNFCDITILLNGESIYQLCGQVTTEIVAGKLLRDIKELQGN